MTNDQAKRTVAKVGKTVEERKQLALRIFEAFSGRKATPEEIADMDATAKEREQNKST